MSRQSGMFFCAAMALLLAEPAIAAGYDAELDPVPFDASNRAVVIDSIGNASATLDGSTLNVSGSFSNFTSPATGGSVRIGLAKGVPGDAIGSLTADHATSGHFSGSVKLSSDQLAALRKQAIYVRIDSEKAPDGNVQGWLEGTK
ncbi:MAG TPA: CHRD domain-containing protein [Rhizomicrobium sp.]|nr:CHRD domain-containing protein [Rhizomicrobium sp.]